jgi:Ca-activated chloride channel homolog
MERSRRDITHWLPSLEGKGSRGHLLLLVAVLLAIGLAACTDNQTTSPSGPKDGSGRTVLTIAYSPEKTQLFDKLVGAFNKQSKGYSVTATKVEMADMLAQATDGKFTAISPDSAIWLTSLDQTWITADPNRSPIVGSLSRYAISPVVVALWQSEAQKMGYPGKAIGWSDLVARATAEPSFRWSHPSTTTSAGLLTVAAEFYASRGKTSQLTKDDLQDPAALDYVRKVEQTIQQYGAESEDQILTRLLDQRTRTVDAFVGQEALVVRYNRQAKGEKLVAVYPREGTLWMDHPLVLLEGPWLTPDQRRGFKELSDFLRSTPIQKIVLQEGYRPTDLSIALDDPSSPISAANGVDPAQPQTLLQVPSASVLESIRSSWALLKRPANIYLVVDVSGSMGENNKLTQAQGALLSFVGQVQSDSDRLALSAFATDVQEVVPLDKLSANRSRLTSAVNGLRASGNTAFYDAVLSAAEKLHAQRDNSRINAVLAMTDGKENASKRVNNRSGPQPLVSALQSLEKKSGVSVLVFTVGYGSDADLDNLRQIAESTRGQAYKGDPETIRKLYQLLSAFF